jgi:hypothetical protein
LTKNLAVLASAREFQPKSVRSRLHAALTLVIIATGFHVGRGWGRGMDRIMDAVDVWVISLAFALAMLGCWCLGWWWGKRSPLEPGDDPGTKFIDASMALLGLLLAFTFAMTLGWHNERRLAVVAESNAIGDFYTCASLLPEPRRAKLQQVIREYAQQELAAQEKSRLPADDESAMQRRRESYNRMTELVEEAIREGTPIAFPLTNTLNNVTSTNASRMVAYQGRLPWSIVLLLFLSSVVPSFLIGEKQGTSRNIHYSGSIAFILVVTLVVYVTLDLNQPRGGSIVVSQDPLKRVIQSMAK